MAQNKYSVLLTANHIRRVFLDYFTSNSHSLIRSSSVKPFGDPSLEFVNAGMNQFKNVFLGLERIPTNRATNTQKCIRVGGKHNDLNCVGLDSYHHTFFEMLGNWSFNDYFKEEACRLAWTLVTSPPYSLDSRRLYVTYFQGDERSNLEADLETKEIWLQLGVPPDRVLPFGLRDNFWEMGPSGPCGPCTELHYDHLGLTPRPHLVNAGLPHLTELWNLVFIQYNRTEDGTLKKLDKRFVDTGMGFERLVALLQGKNSNYDTDLFTPYFSTISKFSGCQPYQGKFGGEDESGLDTAYRILADHTRMIAVALSDNIFPDESHGLRRVIRKALTTADMFSPGQSVQLLVELCRVAGESFAETFPEILHHQKQIEYVISDEEEVWEHTKSQVKKDWELLVDRNPLLRSLEDSVSPGLVAGLRELADCRLEEGAQLSHQLALVLYDRHGLSPQLIHQLAEIFGYGFNVEKLEKDIIQLKENKKSLLHSIKSFNVPQGTLEYIVNNFKPTNDKFKLNYRKNENDYLFDNLQAPVNAIISDGKVSEDLSGLVEGSKIGVILEKTNYWSFFKGDSDTGIVKLYHKGVPVAEIEIEDVHNYRGYLYHFGTLKSLRCFEKTLPQDLVGELLIDEGRRLQLMRNTTAVHLLTMAMKQNFIVNLQSLVVTGRDFRASYSLFGQTMSDDEIHDIEEKLNNLINEEIVIELSSKPINEVSGLADLYIPPFIHLGTNDLLLATFKSKNCFLREVTIGPHVANSRDVGEACIVKVEKRSRNKEISVIGVSGPAVRETRHNAVTLKGIFTSQNLPSEEVLQDLKLRLQSCHLPWLDRIEIEQQLEEFKTSLKRKDRNLKIQPLKNIILEAENSEKFLVLYVGEDLKLEKVLDFQPRIPTFLFGLNKRHLVARCFVPKDYKISAEDWMSAIAKQVGSVAVTSKSEDPQTHLMKPLKIHSKEKTEKIEMLEEFAKRYALQHFGKSEVIEEQR